MLRYARLYMPLHGAYIIGYTGDARLQRELLSLSGKLENAKLPRAASRVGGPVSMRRASARARMSDRNLTFYCVGGDGERLVGRSYIERCERSAMFTKFRRRLSAVDWTLRSRDCSGVIFTVQGGLCNFDGIKNEPEFRKSWLVLVFFQWSCIYHALNWILLQLLVILHSSW